jgi:hypothetical protein
MTSGPLTRIIVGRPKGDYFRSMAKAVLSLLLLIAMILMPSATATAAAPAEHGAHAAAATEHCPEGKDQKQRSHGEAAHCAGCAATLAEIPTGAGLAPMQHSVPVGPRPDVHAPVEPELATPPPKRG